MSRPAFGGRVAGPDEERVALLETTADEVRSCTLCRLHAGRTHAVPGEGPLDADVFLIGEDTSELQSATKVVCPLSAGKIQEKAIVGAASLESSVINRSRVECLPRATR